MIVRRVLKSGKTEVGYEFRRLDKPGRWLAHKDGAAEPCHVNLIARTCTCDAGRNGRLCKHRTKAAELEEEMSAAKKPAEASVNGQPTTAVAKVEPEDRTLALARILTRGDLTALSEEDRASYYLAVCNACELNPASRPFDFISVRGKTGPRTILYATKAATEQLRKRDRVSLTIVSQKEEGGLYVVTVEAATPDGRKDTDVGAVAFGAGANALQGEDRANAVMKAMTKAKRRATLSICGLGMLDESEVESAAAPAAAPQPSRAPDVVQVQAPAPAAASPQPAPTAAAPQSAFDRIGTLRQIQDFAEKLKIDSVKMQKGLENAYGKSTLQALLDNEMADLHKRLAAKITPTAAV